MERGGGTRARGYGKAALVVTATLAGPVLAPADTALAACDGSEFGSGSYTVAVGPATRSFLVRAPAEYGGRTPAPVVFAFHPFGMNAQYMASRAPVARFWPEAIVVYPNGMPRPGAAGQAWQGRSGELDDRDLRFFDAVLAWLRERACIDNARIFVLGYSNGAGLAYLLACERGEQIAAVAAAAGA